jgi:hypothetical protein
MKSRETPEIGEMVLPHVSQQEIIKTKFVNKYMLG